MTTDPTIATEPDCRPQHTHPSTADTAGLVFVEGSRCERERVCRPEDEAPCPTCVREFVRFGVKSS